MPRRLPTLVELHHDVNKAFENDQLNLLLNQPPSKEWLKKYPAVMGIQGEYLPIDKVDFLMDYIFQEWRPEILREGLMLNSVYMVVRLHYKNPLTGEWTFKDGCGAVPVQVDSTHPDGSKVRPTELDFIKSRAIQIALPVAKQQAIKDAAEEIGKLFGRDLNRKDTIMFAGAYGNDSAPSAPAQSYQQPQQPAQAQQQQQQQQQTQPAAQANFAFNANDL